MGIGMLVILLVLTINEEALQYLLNISPLFIMFVLVLRGCSLVCWGLRIRFLHRGLGVPLALPRAVNLVLLGLLSNITPPGQAGGGTFRIYELGGIAWRRGLPLPWSLPGVSSTS
jgi:uncharacterized protein (TIRG00374 family)